LHASSGQFGEESEREGAVFLFGPGEDLLGGVESSEEGVVGADRVGKIGGGGRGD
jgi:hypothetical protein